MNNLETQFCHCNSNSLMDGSGDGCHGPDMPYDTHHSKACRRCACSPWTAAPRSQAGCATRGEALGSLHTGQLAAGRPVLHFLTPRWKNLGW